MEIIISIIFSVIILSIFFILKTQKSINQLIPKDDESLLSEWDCPECGFHIQLGNSCTYCYTQKPL
jgi:hypothetical protein